MVLGKINIRQVLAHLALWACFVIFLLYPAIVQGRRILFNLPIHLSVAIGLFYLNYVVLVPKLLLKKKTLVYVAVAITLLLLIFYGLNLYSSPQFPEDPSLRFRRPPNGNSFRQPLMFFMLFCVPLVVSTALKIYTVWRKNEELRKITEKEKINAELQFLKTQLNPHFLFNSLNTIYSLAIRNSSDTAEAIMNISELMRYMLYEANKDKVPLAKEINYLKNYIHLQRLRLSDNAKVKIKISGEEQGKEIAPLLFIAFVENAFKYGTDFKGNTDIEINLAIKEQAIHLYVKNILGAYQSKEGSSGIGIENVRSRLNLLYPNAYDLEIDNDEIYYTVHLHLNLKSSEVYYN